MKRVLSVALSLIMLLSCISVLAAAQVQNNVNDGSADGFYGTNNNGDTLTVMKANKQQSDIIDGTHQGVAAYVPKTNFAFMRASENDTFSFMPRLYLQLYQRSWNEWVEHIGFMKKSDMTLNSVEFKFAPDNEDGGHPGSNSSYKTTWNGKDAYLLGFDGYYGSMKGTYKGSKDEFTAPEGYEVCEPTQDGQADIHLWSRSWLGMAYIYSYDIPINVSVNFAEGETEYNGDLNMDVSWAGQGNEPHSLLNKVKFDIKVVDLVPLNKLLTEVKTLNENKPSIPNTEIDFAYKSMNDYVNDVIYANGGSRDDATGHLKGDRFLSNEIVNTGENAYTKKLTEKITAVKKSIVEDALKAVKKTLDDTSISQNHKTELQAKYNELIATYSTGTAYENVALDTILGVCKDINEKHIVNGYDFPELKVYKRQVRFVNDGVQNVKSRFSFRTINSISKEAFDRTIKSENNLEEVGFIAIEKNKQTSENYEAARTAVENGTATATTAGEWRLGKSNTVNISQTNTDHYMQFAGLMTELEKDTTYTDDIETVAFVKYKRSYILNGEEKTVSSYVWYKAANEAPIFTKYDLIKSQWIEKYGIKP